MCWYFKESRTCQLFRKRINKPRPSICAEADVQSFQRTSLHEICVQLYVGTMSFKTFNESKSR
jgi:hypothetical protein